MPGEHALLSASSSKRWLNCPPSAKEEAALPEKTSSYAKEGTEAHNLAELILLGYREKTRFPSLSEGYDKEMVEYVEEYTQFVIDQHKELGGSLFVEQRLDYSEYAPEGFGTGDAVIFAPIKRTLAVTDLKYGKGVPVYAEGNSQLKLYALGALNEHDILCEVDQVIVTIVQPRLYSISTVTYTTEELRAWGESIKPAAQAAFKGEGEHKIGPWCQFCKVMATCPLQREQALRIAKETYADFETPGTFKNHTDFEKEKIIEVVKVLPQVVAYLKALMAYVTDEMLEGNDFEGLKLVKSAGRRKVANEEEVIKLLKRKKVKKADYMKETLEGIGKLEKLLGKDKKDLLAPFLEYTSGKLEVVEETDTREAFQPFKVSAMKDFSDLDLTQFEK